MDWVHRLFCELKVPAVIAIVVGAVVYLPNIAGDDEWYYPPLDPALSARIHAGSGPGDTAEPSVAEAAVVQLDPDH